MNDLLLQLRDKGNTVLVVEHKPETIAIGDHVVDLGPKAGSEGGEVMFEGTVEGLRESDTITGRHLDDRATLKDTVREADGKLEIRGADTNNLRDVDVDIPLGVLTVLTGVAGSGKSSLIRGSVEGREGVVTVDQGAIRGSRRSNPATYTGPARPDPQGVREGQRRQAGAVQRQLGRRLPRTATARASSTPTSGSWPASPPPCEECEGKRFDASVLEYTFGGKDISEVLAMSVAEAEAFFADGDAKVPAAHKILDRLADVGLGYLTLGQPLTTLSGGERQRLKLATHMGEKGGVYVLDEPTTGLHLADVEQLLGLLDRLVESGKSVIVIEHHQAVMAHADWIIDLGPGAGQDGGRIVFEGTPADLVARALHAHRRAPRRVRGRLTCATISRCPQRAKHLGDLARLRRVRDRIDREYAQPLDVEALARGAHMSAGHLSRQFRLAYGESPYSYLMTRRIERAMALLRRGDLSVTEVCFEVGCSSLGTFSTRFTELVGMPPSTYREQAAQATAGMPSVRGQAGDQTGQESRSAGRGPRLA